MQVDFSTPEYQADGSFQNADYEFFVHRRAVGRFAETGNRTCNSGRVTDY